ncbi:MAG: glucuronate isomerase [Clostridia bacterium]|nr:glucuronate isomerase [Clostridia bacterium]
MTENFLLKSDGALRLYFECAKDLPIIDFHNHIAVADIKTDKKYENIVDLWLNPDPYKHRLMRICGVDEHFITGAAEPFEKFQKYCEIFPFLAGNPVYDWSRMELSSVFGVTDAINSQNAKRIYDKANEMLVSPEFSNNGILSHFNIEYQSPVATLLEDLSSFDGKSVAPSLRADDLLAPTDAFKSELSAKSGVAIVDDNTYLKAVGVVLDRFSAKGCRFADHSLDAGFFKDDADGKKTDMLVALGNEYSKRGWTLLLHLNAKRRTSPRLLSIAGPAGGFAATGESFNISAVADILGKMEQNGALPDTVLFPLNMSDQAPLAIFQGSFSQDGVPSKVQLGPAWWWCDHKLGIENTLNCIASFGVVSQFIGMTTDSRSILSFVRHDYFRRLLCSWLDEQNNVGEWDMPPQIQKNIIKKICYENAKLKIQK